MADSSLTLPAPPAPGEVLFVSHLFPNPRQPHKGVFVRELARHIAQRTPVRLVAPVPWFPVVRPRRGLSAVSEQDGLRVAHPTYLALPPPLFAWRWRPVARALRPWATVGAWSAVHLHWPFPDAAGALGAGLGRTSPTVLTIHGHAAITPPPPHPHARPMAAALRSISKLLPVSEELAETLTKAWQIARDRQTVIPNGMDSARFHPLNRAECRHQLGLKDPASTPILLSVARLSPEKALDRLLHALSSLGHRPWHLYLVGEGPERSKLQRLIATLKLADRVTLAGPCAHARLPLWYNAADLFILPSHTEGSPVVLPEALACGCPVVASHVGGIPDLISSSVLGFTCPPREVAPLTARLSDALSRPWDRAAIAEQGRRFSWQAAADHVLLAYAAARDRVFTGALST